MKIKTQIIRHQSLIPSSNNAPNSDLDKIILNYLLGSLKARTVRSVATTCKSLYKLVKDTFPGFASLEPIIMRNAGTLCYPYLRLHPHHNERAFPGFGALIPIKDRESLIAGASLRHKPIENINKVSGIFRLLDMLFMEQFDQFGHQEVIILDEILKNLSADDNGFYYGCDISELFDKCCRDDQPIRLSDKLLSLVISKKDNILLFHSIISTIEKHTKSYHKNMPFLKILEILKNSFPQK